MRVSVLLVFVVISTVIFSSADVDKLQNALELFSKERFKDAFNMTDSLFKKNNHDILIADVNKMVGKRIAYNSLKKAYTLFSEGFDRKGQEELNNALKYNPEYTLRVEGKYTTYIEEMSEKKAAEQVILDLLKNPEPSKTELYLVSKRIRERAAHKISKQKLMLLNMTKEKVNKLKAKGKWDEAIEVLNEYLLNNPEDIDAKLMLSNINKEAAADFYEQAVRYFEKAKVKEGVEAAEKSKLFDSVYFESKLEQEMNTAKAGIASEDTETARRKLIMLKELMPEDAEIPVLIRLFEESSVGFLERSMELYKNSDYKEAAVRFEYHKLKEPKNKEVNLFYHLSMARMFIQEGDLDRVKDHLIYALNIAPDEIEARRIFDRLQDVLEALGG